MFCFIACLDQEANGSYEWSVGIYMYLYEYTHMSVLIIDIKEGDKKKILLVDEPNYHVLGPNVSPFGNRT
jgi:hypothetical protein